MKHSIRQHIINAQGFKTTKVIKVEGELGSGILDKNGREIFEGDIVEIENFCFTYTVLFKNGVFTLGRELLKDYLSKELEVVGHTED